jgi:glycosyltransferase involved in cell wall biosynthesis
MSAPLVSIIIPSYKAGHFEQALRSAIGQTYPHIEILVSDNCPTEEIRDICAKFPRVIYQRSPITGSENVSSALFSGKGEFIKPLFDDDLLHPFCVERMVAAMALHPQIELVYSASQVINIDNQRVTPRRPFPHSGMLGGRDLARMLVLSGANVVGEFTSILFRRKRLWDIGHRDIYLLGGHDFRRGLADVALYCNLALPGQSYYIDEELSYFRRDAALASNSNPAANPLFGLAYSEGVDLVLAAHRDGWIDDADLAGRQHEVRNLLAAQGGYPQVVEACARYEARLAALGGSDHRDAS